MNTIESGIFRIDGNMVTPFDLTQYACNLSKITGITIEFAEFESEYGAMVDVDNYIIYLRPIDVTKPFDYTEFRKTKSFLCHECAHLMYPDDSYSIDNDSSTAKEKYIESLASAFDDLRIETLMGLDHAGIREDFQFLINEIWKDVYKDTQAKAGHGMNGDFSEDLAFSFFWACQKRYRNAHLAAPEGLGSEYSGRLLDGMEEFFDSEIAPILDPFMVSRDSAIVPARQVHDLLAARWPECFREEPPGELLQTKPETGEIKTHQMIAADPGARNPGCTADTYFEGEIDIMHSLFTSQSALWGGAPVYHWLKRKYDPLTQWARSMFERILLTPKSTHGRYETSGVFVPRRAAHVVTSKTLRVFRPPIRHLETGFDVTLLLDMSGSMDDLKRAFYHNRLTGEVKQLEYDSGMGYLFPVLLVLAEALNEIKGINLEILGYTADCRLIPDEVGYGFYDEKSPGSNIVYIIKSFTDKNTGVRMERLSGICSNPMFSAWNYDIGALKTAYSRLKAYSSSNRKLLIVLSDCMPNSSHIPDQETAVRLTRNTIAEMEKYIGVFGIGIYTDAVKQLYTHYAVVEGPEGFFITSAVNCICSLIINIQKGGF